MMIGDGRGDGVGTDVMEESDILNHDFDFDFSLFNDEDDLFANLFPSSSSSCSAGDDHHHHHHQSSMSSLFRDIEDKLMNDDEQEEKYQRDENTTTTDSGYVDEFFSDLQLPSSFVHQHHPQSQSQSQDDQIHQEMSMDDLLINDDVPPPSPLPGLNTNYSPSNSSSDQVVTTIGTPVLILNDPETSTPESQVSFQDDGDDDQDNDQNEHEKPSLEKKKTISTTDSASLEDKENDDPNTKKRKRQMRNRDAAVRSRERKKMYVKDLEVKSKYLEAECIRLQRLLQCCAAENHALHFQLQEKAFSASRTKQESAVLFLESLLLGSLLWFLGILGLFSPEMLRVQLPADLLLNVENQKVVDLVALGRAKSKSIGLGTLRLFFKSKRCKASRSKMKNMICNGAVAA